MGPFRPSGEECRREPTSPPWVHPRTRRLGVYRRRSLALGCTAQRRPEARSMRPVEKVLERLEGIEQRNGGFMALCPSHDDHTPSLSVSEGDGGKALVRCFAGCETGDV